MKVEIIEIDGEPGIIIPDYLVEKYGLEPGDEVEVKEGDKSGTIDILFEIGGQEVKS